VVLPLQRERLEDLREGEEGEEEGEHHPPVRPAGACSHRRGRQAQSRSASNGRKAGAVTLSSGSHECG
jgi:hypothetical protein